MAKAAGNAAFEKKQTANKMVFLGGEVEII